LPDDQIAIRLDHSLAQFATRHSQLASSLPSRPPAADTPPPPMGSRNRSFGTPG
jgi:hypothetical protein